MDLEHKSIERIKLASQLSLHHYGKPLICTYSGGKDSDVMLELFKRSGIRFEVQHSHTTVDAPQTVYHIRETFRNLEESGIKCKIRYPKLTMWDLIVKKKMPPTRRKRYCCSYLKEESCRNRMIATGVRWNEGHARTFRKEYEVLGRTKKDSIGFSDNELQQNSSGFIQMAIQGTEMMLMNDNSAKRMFIEKCEMKAKTICNPIIDWSDGEIFDFINSERININVLYDMGFTRCGCIGCPMTSKGRYFEFRVFPKYKQAYINAFGRMLASMKNDGSGREARWKSGEDVFLWWMEDKNISGQLSIQDVWKGEL